MKPLTIVSPNVSSLKSATFCPFPFLSLSKLLLSSSPKMFSLFAPLVILFYTCMCISVACFEDAMVTAKSSPLPGGQRNPSTSPTSEGNDVVANPTASPHLPTSPIYKDGELS